MLHSALKPHTRYRKFSSTCVPYTVCSTSGWNCTPYSFFSAFSTAAKPQPSVVAMTRKPGAMRSTSTPWLIQYTAVSGTLANSGEPPLWVSSTLPYSRVSALRHSPPSRCIISCSP